MADTLSADQLLAMAPMGFHARQTFRDMGNEYVEGMSYTLRPGNERLARHLAEWLAVGRVGLGRITAGRGGLVVDEAKVAGSGEVKGPA